MSSDHHIVISVDEHVRENFFTDADLAYLSELGTVTIDPDPLHHSTQASLDALASADAIITGWESCDLTPFLDGMPRLRLIAHSGGSVRYVVQPEVFDRGIRVSSQTQLNAEPVAEYTLGMILLSAKDIFRAQEVYRLERGKSASFLNDFSHVGLYGATIGLIGSSRISRRVVEMLRPFPVKIKMWSRHLDDAQAAKMGVQAASLEEVLSTCDVVSLHSALTESTRHMLGAQHFAMIKDGATFINTARGAICDQDALVSELQSGRIRGILDVTDPEIPDHDSPLWTLPNVVLTPHCSGSNGRELYRLGRGAIDDTANFFAGRPIVGEFSANEYAGRA